MLCTKKPLIVLCVLFLGNTSTLYALTDEEITKAVEIELALSRRITSPSIEVNTENGIVTLSGPADNILERDRAVKITASIRGVRAVVNNIYVTPLERSDIDLYNDIIDALLFDPITEEYEIEAEADDGVVTLSGTVDSWAEREICLQVVKGVKGVIRIHNNIQITYISDRSDYEIKTEIERRLNLDPYIEDGFIDITVNNRKVSLTGTVGSFAEKSRAFEDCWVRGVKGVDFSGLQVEPWTDDEMTRDTKWVQKSDKEIKQAVKDAFLYDPRVMSFNISVSIDNGVATLTGQVKNLQVKQAAEQDAKNTIGVHYVKNLIQVKFGASISDRIIKQRIESKLLWDPIIDPYDIRVAVENGTVFLSGVVKSYYEKKHAEDISSAVNGVIDLENNITVSKQWIWRSDSKIEDDIEDQLYWNSYIDSTEIDVTVENSEAVLSGQVQNWQQFYMAIENAFEGGAKKVRSRLKINGFGEQEYVYHYYDYNYWLW